VGLDPDLADADLASQVAALDRLLRGNWIVEAVLTAGTGMDLPDWYVGAGAIAQTVWNAAHDFRPSTGIKDVDVVYFDPTDLSSESEVRAEERIRAALPGVDVKVDLTNEARVHLWYEERFGVPVRQYGSTEQAIATWPSTASSIGVRRTTTAELVVCAPYGLHDLFALVVRPNKALVPKEVYAAKAARWRATWPRLTVLDW
jgi:uncharacterized protein